MANKGNYPIVQVCASNNPGQYCAFYDMARTFTGVDPAPFEDSINSPLRYLAVLAKERPGRKDLVKKLRWEQNYWSISKTIPCDLIFSETNPDKFQSSNIVKAAESLRTGGAVIFFELDSRSLDSLGYVELAKKYGFSAKWYLADKYDKRLFPLKKAEPKFLEDIYYAHLETKGDFIGSTSLILVLQKQRDLSEAELRQMRIEAAKNDGITISYYEDKDIEGAELSKMLQSALDR